LKTGRGGNIFDHVLHAFMVNSAEFDGTALETQVPATQSGETLQP
jgi:hypothetical protein